MVKIAPSILSGNFLNLEPDLRMINDNADLIHIAVMDGTFVPNISFGVPVIAACRSISLSAETISVPNISFGFPLAEAMAKVMTVPMDVHLMIVNPDKYIERFAKVGAQLISFHLEACEDAGKDPREVIALVKSCGAKAGLAIDPDVPVEKLFPYIEDVDFFLIMSVFAGFGGQKFIEESVDRIKTLKAEMDRRGVVKDIEVDGGVGKANAKTLIDAGATMLVAGSSVFKAEDPAQAIKELRG
ncbi:MAG: ribulose-phosphate 3-epimerase [Bacteroidales bacterium]|nr:ribulose-phosphate 3-epimerase [Bacteroidales bacterium]